MRGDAMLVQCDARQGLLVCRWLPGYLSRSHVLAYLSFPPRSLVLVRLVRCERCLPTFAGPIHWNEAA